MRSLIQQHRQFADVMSKIAILQIDLCNSDCCNVAAQIVDWSYILDWSAALSEARETTPPEISQSVKK